MNTKWTIWLAVGLLAAVIGAALYFPALRRQVNKAAQATEKTAEQARRELIPPGPVSSGEARMKVKMFWGAKGEDGILRPVIVELPLAADPVLRAKQVVNTLLAGPVDSDARTLPPDAALLAFYILPDGTAVADFSDELRTSTPSGIQSEQLAIDSLARTLEANVPQIQRLKILIHGQETETLAGHVDLRQTFQVNLMGAAPATSKPSATSAITGPIERAVEKMKAATKR
jgi:spore germination protein GerM